MRDDYLWDRSGAPDPEVERLEKLLGRFRSQRSAPALQSGILSFRRRRWPSAAPVQAVAAGLVLMLAGAWIVSRPVRVEWEVARLEGIPKAGPDRIRQIGRLAVGEWLETDSSSRAQIKVGRIGTVDVQPNSRLKLLAARWTNHRLSLERGEIHARIWAPPRLFFVETPSALATDLGCEYTLTVDESGGGRLQVTHGWVSFEWQGRESFVTAGASCLTRPGIGPGTPYYDDASEAFRTALSKLDFEDGGSEALDVILAEARRRDTLTLWHLLSRVPEADRGRIFDRMAETVEVPETVTREAVVRGDRAALKLWWEELGLDESGWW